MFAFRKVPLKVPEGSGVKPSETFAFVNFYISWSAEVFQQILSNDGTEMCSGLKNKQLKAVRGSNPAGAGAPQLKHGFFFGGGGCFALCTCSFIQPDISC